MMQLSDSDFQRMVSFMQSNFGINLKQKRLLINSRLSASLQAQGYTSFKEFVDELLQKKDKEQVEFVLNKLTTNYTYFMREKDHYDFLMRVILPDLTRRNANKKVLSIWSAGCSTGEEPYNISMCIKEYLGAQASMWDARVLATDISQRVLAEAKDPAYELPADIPPEWRRKYFMKRKDDSGLYTVTPDIRNNVIFRTFNLMEPIRFKLKFDVIFCRNVMIYFDQPTKDALAYITESGQIIRKLRHSSVKRMRSKIKEWRTAYPAGEITAERICGCWQSWDAHAAHGNTYTLRKEIAEQVSKIIGRNLTPHKPIRLSEIQKAQKAYRDYMRQRRKAEKAASAATKHRKAESGR